MKELSVNPTEATVRLTCSEVELFLSAINESLESVDEREFSTRTGFEKGDFYAIQTELKALRGNMK